MKKKKNTTKIDRTKLTEEEYRLVCGHKKVGDLLIIGYIPEKQIALIFCGECGAEFTNPFHWCG